MRRVALAFGLLALVVLAAFLLRLDGGRRGANAAAPESAPSVREDPPAELAPAAAQQIETRVLATEPAVVTPRVLPESEPTAASGGAETLPLAGTIVVLDEQGAEHRAEDGSFSFVLWTGDSGSWHEVEVHGGAWSTALPREPTVQALGVTDVELGGRRAVCGEDTSERIALPEDGWLALSARWPSASLLSVRDRESGRELAPVFLTEVSGWPESQCGHPGPAAASERDLGPSPVTLPPGDSSLGTRTCYARSPGYAWGRIEIDEQRGGERILLLERAGELEVELLGTVGAAGTRLRLFGSEHAPAFEAEVHAAGRVLVEALPVGPYRVKAEIGDYWRDPLVLAEAEAEVVAGGRARVSLTLKELEPRRKVPFEGTLVLPAAWELGEFELAFELLDTPLDGGDGRFSLASSAMEPEGDPPAAYRWSAPAVQPGRYEVELDELAFHAVLTVGDAGLRDARVVVPPPCEVLVRCIEDDTGVEVTSESVSWYCAMPEGLYGWSHERAEWDEALRRWRIRAPQGEVVVGVYGSTYAHASETVQARAGTNEVELRLARPTGLRVVLRDGTTEIPWADGAFPELEPLEGQPDFRSSSSGGGTITLHKKEAGRYRLEVPVVPGYEPVPAVEVTLTKGVVTEHVVELVRKP
ncbi:MAG: hypothetical protein EXS08_02740 [Planctomycetes bacterium]|nr:hypothetical protein [Planctomycetota bacterium]